MRALRRGIWGAVFGDRAQTISHIIARHPKRTEFLVLSPQGYQGWQKAQREAQAIAGRAATLLGDGVPVEFIRSDQPEFMPPTWHAPYTAADLAHCRETATKYDQEAITQEALAGRMKEQGREPERRMFSDWAKRARRERRTWTLRAEYVAAQLAS